MLDFPDSPIDGQVFTDPSGCNWYYEAATNSWTAETAVVNGVVNVTGLQPIHVTGAGGVLNVTVSAATETGVGVVQLATSAEVIAGVNTTKAVTPKASADAIADALTNYIRKDISVLPVLP